MRASAMFMQQRAPGLTNRNTGPFCSGPLKSGKTDRINCLSNNVLQYYKRFDFPGLSTGLPIWTRILNEKRVLRKSSLGSLAEYGTK